MHTRTHTQRIARIEGLAGCQRLQCLWLTENRITEVAGLQACTALQELYLTSNRITAVQGLEALTGLKVGGSHSLAVGGTA
jgi:protein phosphatase 1 regulatory subunit 7